MEDLPPPSPPATLTQALSAHNIAKDLHADFIREYSTALGVKIRELFGVGLDELTKSDARKVFAIIASLENVNVSAGSSKLVDRTMIRVRSQFSARLSTIKNISEPVESPAYRFIEFLPTPEEE